MGLLAQAKKDIEQITSNLNGWAAVLRFTSPTNEEVTINGLHTKHWTQNDPDTGRVINSKNAHISFSEQWMIDAGYQIRSASGEVYLSGHKVHVSDSTGFEKDYIIREWYPDETIGLIVCILGDYGTN
jgi:hypothetical protein